MSLAQRRLHRHPLVLRRYVASVHEVDPGAINLEAKGTKQCPFACFSGEAVAQPAICTTAAAQ